MKKLNLSELHVESFATSESTALRGTVAGHDGSDETGPPYTSLYTCGQQDTCVKGATHCGTCDQPSCIPGTGCGGYTDGVWQC